MRLNRAIVVEAQQVVVVLDLLGRGDNRLFQNNPLHSFGAGRCSQGTVVKKVILTVGDEFVVINWITTGILSTAFFERW